MFKKTTPHASTTDPGLQDIADWYTWFVTGHAQRLRDDGVDADTFAREHAAIVAVADAVTARMREDYLRARSTHR
jgi:hypothetical protein